MAKRKRFSGETQHLLDEGKFSPKRSLLTRRKKISKRSRRKSNHKDPIKIEFVECASTGVILSLFATLLFCLLFFETMTSLKVTRPHAEAVTIVVGFFLLVAVFVSFPMRETIFLFFISVFTARGRGTLISLLILAVLQGPYQNIKINLRQFNGLFICSYNKTVGSENMLAKLITGRVDLEDTFRSTLNKTRDVTLGMEAVFQKLAKGILEVRQFFTDFGKFLGKISYVCNDEVLTKLFDKCVAWFKGAGRDCKKRVWVFLRWTCSIVDRGRSSVCYTLKTLNGICQLPAHLGKLLVDVIKGTQSPFRKWKCPTVQKMFFFEVDFYAEYLFKTSMDMELDEIYAEVEQKIFDEGGFIDIFVRIIKFVVFFQLFCALVSAIRYRSKYLKFDHHDNYVMESPDFQNVNDQRRRLGADSALPLKWREKWRYITRFSVSCSAVERRACCFGCCKMVCILTALDIIVLTDFLLYKAFSSIHSYSQIIDDAVFNQKLLEVSVEGSGFVTKVLRQILETILPKSKLDAYIKERPCEPKFSEPDYATYKFIFIIESCIFLSVLATPYALRCRSAICHRFHPERRHKRTLWLMNQILLRRFHSSLPFSGSTKVMGPGGSVRKVSCWEYWLETTPLLNRAVTYFCGAQYQRVTCQLCATKGKPEDIGTTFTDCLNPECRAKFCIYCAAQLQSTCIVCSAYLFESNEFNVELEKDSSDEEALHKLQILLQASSNQQTTAL